MKSITLLLSICCWISLATGQVPIIIDHNSTDLNVVPGSFITAAKTNLKIWYGHTSHGSQITSGIENLQNHIGEPYTFNPNGIGGALSYQEQTGVDLGHNGDTNWAQVTRQVLNAPGNDRNVIMWSWCGGVSDNTEEGINIYLNKMTELENDYPGIQFIYMTGHLDIWAYTNLKARNQQIRDYCQSNNKILFDFADIESYNPGQEFFDYATDNCDYYSGPAGTLLGNWADEWCGANPGSELCWSCSCAHSKSLNCNLKGRAFWWMMARMAGWEGTVGVDNKPTKKHNLRCWYSNGFCHASFMISQQSEISLQMLDAYGNIVAEINETFPAGNQQINLPINNFSSGLYIVRLSDHGQVIATKKILVN